MTRTALEMESNRVARLVADIAAQLQADKPAKAGHALPRYTLFHAANSICSQKVRVVLAQHGCDYVSQSMNIFAGQTYLPSYVRLRLIGCERANLPLMTTHTGSTAASKFGCDPAVVPTIVDNVTKDVVVDSKLICERIDATFPDQERLRPDSLASEIDAEIDIIDGLPNYPMLVGRIADDQRPAKLQAQSGVDFSMSKVARCDAYIAECAGDLELVAAFSAKRAKEFEAANNLFSEDAVRNAYNIVESECTKFNARVEKQGDQWLFGSRLTMADLFWVTSLLRIENLGAHHFWTGGKLPALERYLTRGKQLDSIQNAILKWPGALF